MHSHRRLHHFTMPDGTIIVECAEGEWAEAIMRDPIVRANRERLHASDLPSFEMTPNTLSAISQLTDLSDPGEAVSYVGHDTYEQLKAEKRRGNRGSFGATHEG